MQPRPAHYQLAHRILAEDAHRPQGDTWPVIVGPNGPAYLAMKWDMAGGDPQLAAQIRIVMNQPISGHHLTVVSMPSPMAATEAYYVAYARPANGGPLRYFVMERGIQDAGAPTRSYVAEYRPGGIRIRHGDLPTVSMEAFTGHLMQELATAPATGVPPFQHSTPPMAFVPSQAKSGGGGKWVALGAVGLLGAGFAAYMAWNHMRMMEWQERRDAREAASEQAEKDNKGARKRAEARLTEIGEPYQACLKAERAEAKKALELARSNRVFGTRSVPPNKADVDILANAMAYKMPNDKAPVTLAFNGETGTEWIPVSRWIARTGTACNAPPKAYRDLEQALQTPKPGKYDFDRKKQNEEHTEKLDELVTALDGAGTHNAAKPSSMVIADRSCTQTVVSHYDDVSGNPLYVGGVDLLRYNCTASLTWVSLDGKRLASVTANGSAHPGRQPATTTATDLAGINADSLAKARQNASDQLQKTVSAWGGAAKK